MPDAHLSAPSTKVPRFSTWTRWDHLFGKDAKALDEQIPKYPGCYAIAVATETPPPIDSLLTDPAAAPAAMLDALLYVGETHGSSTHLRARLEAFARSAAAFDPEPERRRSGHVAGWRYGNPVWGDVSLHKPDTTWVCWRDTHDVPDMAQGIEAVWLESTLLRNYARRYERLPPFVVSTRRAAAPQRDRSESFDERERALVQKLIDSREDLQAHVDVLLLLRDRLGALPHGSLDGYGRFAQHGPARLDAEWHGVGCALGDWKQSLYVGWSNDASAGVAVSLWRGKTRVWPDANVSHPTHASTVEAFEAQWRDVVPHWKG